MRERLQAALQWCGFTPTAREQHLERKLRRMEQRLRRVVEVAVADRQRLDRVEALLAYRERLGAGTVDTASLRAALDGEHR